MEIIGLITFIIGLFFVAPILGFGLGWLSGWIIKVTVGGFIVKGLALLGINIPLDSLPLLFGTIAIIASFFKPFIPSKDTFNLKKGL